ncbi:hypothetical protein COO60DRAFT_1505663, partial [Scenedesmus sp. NREL 46B-D3]
MSMLCEALNKHGRLLLVAWPWLQGACCSCCVWCWYARLLECCLGPLASCLSSFNCFRAGMHPMLLAPLAFAASSSLRLPPNQASILAHAQTGYFFSL